MPRHIIRPEELRTIKPFTSEMAGSYGKGSHKTLNCITDPINRTVKFQVLNQRIQVGMYNELWEAVEKYNALD